MSLTNRLLRYSKKCLSEKLDPDFADAVFEANKIINELSVHGKWIPRILPFNHVGNECSVCLAISAGAMKPYYCPNCGAKMDGET